MLHEIGHVALHWDKLKPNQADFVTAAQVKQEQEAWAFAGAVRGLAMGDVVQDMRSEKRVDSAWNCLVREQYKA